MSKVLGLHETTLHHGISAEEFERFVLKELPPAMAEFEHTKMYVLKGIRGDRDGRYLTVVEVDNEETYLRYWPERGQPSEEAKEMLAKLEPFIEKWRTFANFGNPTFTDYVRLE